MPKSNRSTLLTSRTPQPVPTWPKSTELVGITLTLEPETKGVLFPQYPVALHAWFLDQMRQTQPNLSQAMHDQQLEKNFTLSRLDGLKSSLYHGISVEAKTTYQWQITAFSQPLVNWMASWVKRSPASLSIGDLTFHF